jgi:glycyl-tRNA synthetase alpha chain
MQQVGGIDCDPVSVEMTYGLERLAMYIQGVDNVFDLRWNYNAPDDPVADKKTYRDIYHQAEREFSAYNFEHANTEALFRHFRDAEAECAALLAAEPPLALPAYDQCIKASHLFNLLDARGVISVTERQGYIGRVRALATKCCKAWRASQESAAKAAA